MFVPAQSMRERMDERAKKQHIFFEQNNKTRKTNEHFFQLFTSPLLQRVNLGTQISLRAWAASRAGVDVGGVGAHGGVGC